MEYLVFRLIYMIVHEAMVPNEMKQSYMVLVYKKGQKSDPMNYRPISLL